MKKIYILAVLLVLQGCVTPLNIYEMTVGELQNYIVYDRSEFDSIGTYESISLNDSEVTLFKSQSSSVTLRSFESDFGISHQLYFYLTYSDSDWRFYDAVNLVGGKTLDTNVLDRNVISCSHSLGCTYSEILTLEVDNFLFEIAEKEGLRFRLGSRYRDIFWEYNIPENFFIAQNNYIKNN
jgi:hypothetical protein